MDMRTGSGNMPAIWPAKRINNGAGHGVDRTESARLRTVQRRPQGGICDRHPDGVAVTRTETDPFSRRTVFVADDALFTGKEHHVEVVL